MAKGRMPSIGHDNIDILIVELMGKEFSGDGMDPNITGAECSACKSLGPSVGLLVALDLSEASKGNAIGVGSADFITRKLYDKIDKEIMYTNAVTAKAPHAAKIPVVLESEEAVIAAAIGCVKKERVEDIRIVRIKNTMALDEVWVTKNML